MPLRPQQEHFEQAIRQAFARVKSVCAVAPTGFGKGYVIADMAAKAAAKDRHPLVITDRKVIVKQLHAECSRSGLQTGIIMGSEERNEEAAAQVASIQTITRRGFRLPETGFVILDECHKAHDAYKKLIEEHLPGVPVLGLTATPVGPNGVKLAHFQELVEPIRNTEVIEAGDLLRVTYIAPFEPDMGGIDLKSASQDTIGQRVEQCTVYGDVFREWDPYKHLQTLAILPSRATANGFAGQCRERGISALVIDGTTSQSERDDGFAAFKAEDVQMLVSVDVLREGFDAPNAGCLLDLQPTHSFRVYWQKIGRVKRPHPGQETAIVIDMAGNLWRHMLHPDQDPPWEELTTDSIEALIEKKAGKRCPKCGSKDIYSIPNHGWKCEDCKHEWAQKNPWVCPSCKQALSPWQKVIGGVCPNCGAKAGKPIKRIRMEDGEMRTVSAEEIKRRKKSKANTAQTCWDRLLWTSVNWNKKHPTKPQKRLSWVRAMFKKKTGQWPKGLRNCPKDWSSADWKRRPEDVFPWMASEKQEA